MRYFNSFSLEYFSEKENVYQSRRTRNKRRIIKRRGIIIGATGKFKERVQEKGSNACTSLIIDDDGPQDHHHDIIIGKTHRDFFLLWVNSRREG